MTASGPSPQPGDLPRIDHIRPLRDSRGLPSAGAKILAPDGPGWQRLSQGRRSLTPVTGGYAPEGTPTTLRPCYFCGKPAPVVPGPDPDYAVCGFPLNWGGPDVTNPCLDREKAERAAVTELIAEPAPEPVAEEPAKPAAKRPAAPRKPRARASTARAKPAAKTAKAAPEGGTEPPEGGAA